MLCKVTLGVLKGASKLNVLLLLLNICHHQKEIKGSVRRSNIP
jgi:hypothetical protein